MTRKLSIVLFVLAAVLLPLIGFNTCISPPRTITLTPTQPTVVTPITPTPTACPAVTPIPQPRTQSETFVYVLVDQSNSYCRYVKHSFDILEKVLPEILKPGDQIYLGWISDNSEHDIFFKEQIPSAPSLDATPPPTFMPLSLSLTPTPSPPSGTVTNMEWQKYQATLTAVEDSNKIIQNQTEQMNQEMQNEYYCDVLRWNQEVQLKLPYIQKESEAIVSDFYTDKLSPELRNRKPQCTSGTHIYEALYSASQSFQLEQEHHAFSRYILLIFSDMDDDHIDDPTIDPSVLPIDLQHVEVTIVLYCDKATLCPPRMEHWEEILIHQSHAESVNFILYDEVTPEKLSNYLLQGG